MISVRTIPFILAGVTITAVCSTLAILASYLRNAEKTMHTISQLWARLLFAAGGIEFRIVRPEQIPADPAFIIMANHKSHLDPPLFIASFPHNIRFLTKQELFAIPVFGRALQRVGHIAINRKNHDAALRSLKVAGERIRAGTTVLVFPEGTRFEAPGLGPFKKGGFHLALESHVPILPVWVQNSDLALPKGTVQVHAVPVTAYVGAAIQPEEFSGCSVDDLMMTVREQIDLLRQEAARASTEEELQLAADIAAEKAEREEQARKGKVA